MKIPNDPSFYVKKAFVDYIRNSSVSVDDQNDIISRFNVGWYEIETKREKGASVTETLLDLRANMLRHVNENPRSSMKVLLITRAMDRAIIAAGGIGIT